MSGDEVFGPHLLRILLLAMAVRDDRDLCSHVCSEQNSKMSESAQTNNADFLCGCPCTIALERRIDTID